MSPTTTTKLPGTQVDQGQESLASVAGGGVDLRSDHMRAVVWADFLAGNQATPVRSIQNGGPNHNDDVVYATQFCTDPKDAHFDFPVPADLPGHQTRLLIGQGTGGFDYSVTLASATPEQHAAAAMDDGPITSVLVEGVDGKSYTVRFGQNIPEA